MQQIPKKRKSLLTLLLARYLPAIGRFLIVVTFLEDALRIITQWRDQLSYLHDYRHSKPSTPWGIFFLNHLAKIYDYSSHWSQSYVPHTQRHRHDILLFPGHYTKTLRLRCRWTHRRSHHSSSWLWPHLRSQLFPPQPFGNGRSSHGTFRFMGPQNEGFRRTSRD